MKTKRIVIDCDTMLLLRWMNWQANVLVVHTQQIPELSIHNSSVPKIGYFGLWPTGWETNLPSFHYRQRHIKTKKQKNLIWFSYICSEAWDDSINLSTFSIHSIIFQLCGSSDRQKFFTNFSHCNYAMSLMVTRQESNTNESHEFFVFTLTISRFQIA